MSNSASIAWCLAEAKRRYLLFHPKEKLEKAWTGLGTATTYKKVMIAGLMEHAHDPNPGYLCWWKLTLKGAKVVQTLIDHEKRLVILINEMEHIYKEYPFDSKINH
jgi:hypothetical protein